MTGAKSSQRSHQQRELSNTVAAGGMFIWMVSAPIIGAWSASEGLPASDGFGYVALVGGVVGIVTAVVWYAEKKEVIGNAA